MPLTFEQHIQRRLLSWYEKSKRDLPFRRTHDPYKIWISEIMLQQTQVKTMVPYYEKFISRFPTVHSLAQASLEEVLTLWQGLGYYSRAKNLHHAAQTIDHLHGGQLPTSSHALIELKGFGPYTSASVASIAFNEPIVAIDGNVKRVVSRLFGTNTDVEELAKNLKHPSQARDFNQSLMELGALICTPQTPECSICPLNRLCVAFKTDQVSLFPLKAKKTIVKHVWNYVFLIQKKQHLLIQQRPTTGRWASLWELPLLEEKKPLTSKEIQTKAKQLGLSSVKKEPIPSFTHVLTHQKIKVEIFSAQAKSFSSKGEWIDISQLHSKPFSILQKKVFKALNLFNS